MDNPTCLNCTYRGRHQSGPHEFFHFCQLQKPEFLSFGQCRFHVSSESVDDIDCQIKIESRPAYFTGVTNNRVGYDFEVRQIGDLIRIGNTEFTATDAEAIARLILQLTFPLLSAIERTSA